MLCYIKVLASWFGMMYREVRSMLFLDNPYAVPVSMSG